MHLYICAYETTPTGTGGIYQFDFDPKVGSLSPISSLSRGIQRASFSTFNRAGSILALADERDAGSVRTLGRDPETGKLTSISSGETGGAHPCHVSFSIDETAVLLTNYTGGSFVTFAVDTEGNLGERTFFQHVGSGPNPARQEAAHPHMVQAHPIDGQIYVSDLGMDIVAIYDLDRETGKLSADIVEENVKLPGGTGPRHFVFNAAGDVLFVIGELASTITVFEQEQLGNWVDRQTISTLPADFSGENTTAQILRSPDGRFIYGSNRGDDSIAIFAVDSDTHRLTLVGHQKTGGKTPRNFTIDPSGDWLLAANQDSDSVVVFRRESETGLLAQVGEPLAVPKPMCLTFAPIMVNPTQ